MGVERCQKLLDNLKETQGALNGMGSDFGLVGWACMGYKTCCALPILLLSWFWATQKCSCVTPLKPSCSWLGILLPVPWGC